MNLRGSFDDCEGNCAALFFFFFCALLLFFNLLTFFALENSILLHARLSAPCPTVDRDDLGHAPSKYNIVAAFINIMD